MVKRTVEAPIGYNQDIPSGATDKKYPEAALAEDVIKGKIPAESIRKIVGVLADETIVYRQDPLGELESEIPKTYTGPQGQRRR